MKLPNAELAAVPEDKVTRYLLAEDHPIGRAKAAFFAAFGFSAQAWGQMVGALRQHAGQHEVARVEASPFGTRYVIEGALIAPDGRSPVVRTVWFVEAGDDVPRFVTAYPL